MSEDVVLQDDVGGTIVLPPGFTTLAVIDNHPRHHCYQFRDPSGFTFSVGASRPSPEETCPPAVLDALERYAATLDPSRGLRTLAPRPPETLS